MQNLLEKLVLTLTAIISLQTPAHFGGTTMLDCSAAGTRDVYDTPTGQVEAGYYDPISGIGTLTDATSGLPNILAKVVGTQAFEICKDATRKTYEYPVTQQQYDSFQTNTPLPAKSI